MDPLKKKSLAKNSSQHPGEEKKKLQQNSIGAATFLSLLIQVTCSMEKAAARKPGGCGSFKDRDQERWEGQPQQTHISLFSRPGCLLLPGPNNQAALRMTQGAADASVPGNESPVEKVRYKGLQGAAGSLQGP